MSSQSQITNHKSQIGPLVVVSGPSGVGKTTVVERVLAETGLPLRRVVTATTREPRPGEEHGRDYHFWTADQFERAVADGRMLEHAAYGGQWYGTPRDEVDPHRAAGVGVVLVIDVQGAEQVRALYPDDHCSVFLEPPSWAELEARLRARNTEDEAKLARRLATAHDEVMRAGEFDKRIVNANLDDAVRELAAVVRDMFTRGAKTC